MKIASLAEVKARLSEYVKLCEEEKELVIITKHGRLLEQNQSGRKADRTGFS